MVIRSFFHPIILSKQSPSLCSCSPSLHHIILSLLPSLLERGLLRHIRLFELFGGIDIIVKIAQILTISLPQYNNREDDDDDNNQGDDHNPDDKLSHPSTRLSA